MENYYCVNPSRERRPVLTIWKVYYVLNSTHSIRFDTASVAASVTCTRVARRMNKAVVYA